MSQRMPQDASWAQESSEILKRLEDPLTPRDEQFVAVLFAEPMGFHGPDRIRLLTGLRRFISDHRFTEEPEAITVIGSAIRKYAMNMAESDFDAYADWLSPTQTSWLHQEVELELVKAVGYRVQYALLDRREHTDFANLRCALENIAGDYLSPRLILRENYAAILLCAVVALVILDANASQWSSTASLMKRVKDLRVTWFADLMARRIEDAIESISKHDLVLSKRIRSRFPVPSDHIQAGVLSC